MFLNYANSSHDTPSGYMNKHAAIEINSCGTYRLDTDTEIETCRPEGRKDYQLIYLACGKGYFYFQPSIKPTIVEAGSMVLYHPNEFQKYEYYGNDHANVYWIHFTGSYVEQLFQNYGLDISQNVFSAGTKSFYSLTFDQIILELQLRKDFYEESAALLFTHIIMIAGRNTCEITHNRQIPPDEIEEVMIYFREHYQENINVEELVKSKGASVSSFFRKFKSYTGMTPLQYLLEIRFSYATNLLETTRLQINEISNLVGYDNALYFSRLFHKRTGMSPKEYRAIVGH